MSQEEQDGLSAKMKEKMNALIVSLKRGEVEGAYHTAQSTVTFFLEVLEDMEWDSTLKVMDAVRSMAIQLQSAAPAELTIGNMARRTLMLIREAYSDASKEAFEDDQSLSQQGFVRESTIRMEKGPSLLNIMGDEVVHTFENPFDIKEAVLHELSILKEDLAVVYKDIAKHAKDHIHANEVILVIGHSSSVEGFLKQAHSSRKFEVIVAEGLPNGDGRYMADRLSRVGIPTTLIPDSNIFAIMPRVNKVITGVHCVMANGVLLAITGTHLLAMAARHFSVPFVVLTGLYKLCPLYPYPTDMENFSSCTSPAAILPDQFLAHGKGPAVKVPNPKYEYVPAELVSLYILDQAYHPSIIARLMTEYYHQDDSELEVSET